MLGVTNVLNINSDAHLSIYKDRLVIQEGNFSLFYLGLETF